MFTVFSTRGQLFLLCHFVLTNRARFSQFHWFEAEVCVSASAIICRMLASGAPSRPEVKEHGFAREITEVDRAPIQILEREICNFESL